MIVVADDAALAADGDNAGRRGLAGTVLVHKVAGAAAEAGLPLGAVKQEAITTAESIATMGVADEVIDILLTRLVADRGISAGDRVVLLVNNLGGTPTMELAIIARRAVTFLAEQGITLERAWVGSFLTALEMAGCSLSLARVDDHLLARLDAPTETMAWPASHVGRVVRELPAPRRDHEVVAVNTVPLAENSLLWHAVEAGGSRRR
ncbi:dihydroxyacetone kinase subunit DhaK [Kribbella sp. NPDC058245]|uniref:dihydroxyacetone kinase subunit DhaK n=1 Tax=Kribbella sp. NPDC058245 TaxID=3346399 RepID=UPI0036E58B97